MPKMSRSNNELVGEPVFATKLFFSVFVQKSRYYTLHIIG